MHTLLQSGPILLASRPKKETSVRTIERPTERGGNHVKPLSIDKRREFPLIAAKDIHEDSAVWIAKVNLADRHKDNSLTTQFPILTSTLCCTTTFSISLCDRISTSASYVHELSDPLLATAGNSVARRAAEQCTDAFGLAGGSITVLGECALVFLSIRYMPAVGEGYIIEKCM